jgi:hypothetical protein
MSERLGLPKLENNWRCRSGAVAPSSNSCHANKSSRKLGTFPGRYNRLCITDKTKSGFIMFKELPKGGKQCSQNVCLTVT